MYNILLFLTCVSASVSSQHDCSPDFGVSPFSPTKTTPSTNGPPETRGQPTSTPGTTSTEPIRSTPPPTSPRINTEISRIKEDINDMQQKQRRELYCLETLDKVITTQWQEDVDKISVNDLGNFSTSIEVPTFSTYYSNPESEWIQDGGMHLNKLDKCVENLVSMIAPKLDPEEVECLNRIHSDYSSRERRTAEWMEKFIEETSREQVPFRSFYTYFELVELLFENRNVNALDGELNEVHKDMLEFYIKTEEDKNKKFFIVEQECEWKNAKLFREDSNDDARYQRFGQLIKSLVNRYLAAEILREWVPGATMPESSYNLWSKARETMENEILDQLKEVRSQKRDAQFLCKYAAELANKFFLDQKQILFDKVMNAPLSSRLKTHDKYSYVVALESLLAGKNDSRLSRVQVLVKEFKEGHYCLTNLIRMVENHQRYMTASAFTNDALPYGYTYCLINEMSAGFINPRYCKCQGTFCEEFGLAPVKSKRYQLNLNPNNTYTVTTRFNYKIIPLYKLLFTSQDRVEGENFNGWWYDDEDETPA